MNAGLDAQASQPVEGGPVHRVTLDGTGISFPVRPGERVLDAARRSGHWLPFECGWGSCNRCKATLIEGELTSLFPQAPAIDARDERRRRHLLCQSTTASDAVIKVLSVEEAAPAERPTADYLGTLVSKRDLSPSIAEFRFALTSVAGDDVIPRFRPGQYAVLEIEAGLRRCYSMANVPGTNLVEFVIKGYEGHRGSTRMLELQPGATLPIELPYGDMWLRDVNRPVLLIAGGTGISAVLSLVRGIVADDSWAERNVHVLYGAATRDELVCWDVLEELTAADRMHLHGALVHADEMWSGGHGFVTSLLTGLLAAEIATEHDLLSAEVYLAGPPMMVEAVQAVLDEHGIQRDRIHVDSFG